MQTYNLDTENKGFNELQEISVQNKCVEMSIEHIAVRVRGAWRVYAHIICH